MDNLSRVGPLDPRCNLQTQTVSNVRIRSTVRGTKFERPRTGNRKELHVSLTLTQTRASPRPPSVPYTPQRDRGRGTRGRTRRPKGHAAIAHVVHTVPRSPKRYDNIALMLPASAASAKLLWRRWRRRRWRRRQPQRRRRRSNESECGRLAVLTVHKMAASVNVRSARAQLSPPHRASRLRATSAARPQGHVRSFSSDVRRSINGGYSNLEGTKLCTLRAASTA